MQDGRRFRYDRDSDSVTAFAENGEEATERMSSSLVERLTAQGVPSVLWKGSKGAKLQKRRCPFCNDQGQAYGGPCICVS